MNDVAAIPTAPKANPMSKADGIAKITHGEDARPRTSITARKPTEYRPPRISAQTNSPSAMSPAESGVARIDVNVLL